MVRTDPYRLLHVLSVVFAGRARPNSAGWRARPIYIYIYVSYTPVYVSGRLEIGLRYNIRPRSVTVTGPSAHGVATGEVPP